MEQMYVTPAPGLLVPYPDPQVKKKLPPEGDWVPCSVYWLRRLRDGDVLKGKAPKKGER